MKNRLHAHIFPLCSFKFEKICIQNTLILLAGPHERPTNIPLRFTTNLQSGIEFNVFKIFLKKTKSTDPISQRMSARIAKDLALLVLPFSSKLMEKTTLHPSPHIPFK